MGMSIAVLLQLPLFYCHNLNIRSGFSMQLKPASRGFGDTIANVTKFFGVQPCGGCEKRRDTLNRWLPYKSNLQRNRSEYDSGFSDPSRQNARSSGSLSPTSAVEAVEPQWGSRSTVPALPRIVLPEPEMARAIADPRSLARGARLGVNEWMEIFASTGFRGPDRARGPFDLEGDRRVRRNERREGSAGTSPSSGSGTTPASFACGVDVTAKTKAAVQTAKKEFGSWTNDEKHTACQSLRSLVTGAYAWDIIELHQQVTGDVINNGFRPACATSGATPACGSSVTVDGSCHFAGSANYVIFGVMCKLCNDYYRTMLNDASWYEIIDKDTYRNGIYQFNQNGMLYLIDLYKKYIPLMKFDSPAGNIEAAKRWSIAGYNGWPVGASTPAPDRANCTLTCPVVTKIPNFRVSWYPKLNAYSR